MTPGLFFVLRHLKISVKLPLAMAFFGAFSLLAAEYIALSNAKTIVLDAGRERLATTARASASDVARDLAIMQDDLLLFSQNPTVVNATRAFVTGWRLQGGGPENTIRRRYLGSLQRNVGTAEIVGALADKSTYGFAHRNFNGFLLSHRQSKDYADLYIVSPDGWVVYSAAKRDSFGLNVGAFSLAATGIGRAFGQALRVVAEAQSAEVGRSPPAGPVTEGLVTAFSEYPPGSGTQSAFFAAPVQTAHGTLEGVVIFRLGDDRLDGEIARSKYLGGAGTLQVLGPDEPPQRERQSPGAAATASSPLALQALATRAAQVVGLARSSAPETIAAIAPVPFPGLDLRVLAEQPASEVLRTVDSLRARLVRDGAFALLAITLGGVIIGRSVSKPLGRVGSAMFKVGNGGYFEAIPDRQRGDEIGAIARELDEFRAKMLEAEGVARENAFKRAAFEAASSPMMLVDAGLTILYVNAALEALMRAHEIRLGRTVSKFHPDALTGRNLASLYPGAGRLRDAVVRGENHETVLRVGEAHLTLNMAVVNDAANSIAGFVVEWSDRTESHRMRSLMDVIGGQFPIARFSSDGRLIEANALFSEWLDSESAASVARRWDEIFKPGSANPFSASWASMTQGEGTQATFWLLPPGFKKHGREALFCRVGEGPLRAESYVLVLARADGGTLAARTERPDTAKRETA
ncbi:MAG: PAS domain-containing protein [Pseudomonadota bacterium]